MSLQKDYSIIAIAVVAGLFLSIYNIFYSKYSLNVYDHLKEEKEKLNMQINVLKYKNAKLHKYYIYSDIENTKAIEDK